MKNRVDLEIAAIRLKLDSLEIASDESSFIKGTYEIFTFMDISNKENEICLTYSIPIDKDMNAAYHTFNKIVNVLDIKNPKFGTAINSQEKQFFQLSFSMILPFNDRDNSLLKEVLLPGYE